MLIILSDVRNVFSSASPTLKLRLSRAKRGKKTLRPYDHSYEAVVMVQIHSWMFLSKTFKLQYSYIPCFIVRFLNQHINFVCVWLELRAHRFQKVKVYYFSSWSWCVNMVSNVKLSQELLTCRIQVISSPFCERLYKTKL